MAKGSLALLVTLLTACLPREGLNSACQWPATAPLGSLRADLELAEELATRYMDAHAGPRDPSAAAQAKNRCMGTLLAALAPRHGLTAQQAFQSFGKRSLAIDAAIYLPFLLLYFFAARLLQRRFPQIFVLVALAAGAVLLAQLWAILIESLRLGNPHLGGRALRLPPALYPLSTFLLALSLTAAARLRLR